MKTLLKTGLAALVLSLGAPAAAAPVKVVLAPAIIAPRPAPAVVHVVKPAPASVWVEGHWSRDRFNRRVWVPGYWATTHTRRTVTRVRTPVGTVRTVKMY